MADGKKSGLLEKDVPEDLAETIIGASAPVGQTHSKFDEAFSRYVGSAGEDAEQTTADHDEAIQKIADLTERVKRIHAKLSDTVLGQGNAISVFTTGYFRAKLLSMTDHQRVRPTTYLFVGPSGVGKTFLAESAAEALELPYKRFDMSEYCDQQAAVEFCGSDRTYKNSKEGNFTSYISENPRCVILLDEIEKAHISIIHLFLQILDAGRIRDSHTNQEISLKDVILIFTTNAGKQLHSGSETGDFSALPRKVILNALQRDINPATGQPYFPAAICSRFASGNVVMFNQMTAHDLRAIAKREVLRHAENFEREFGVKIEIDERVFTALLFAEGGRADARAVRSRAEAFLDGELFELFRLTASDSVASSIGDIESIKIGVELPTADREIASLFEDREIPKVLLFSSKRVADLCRSGNFACEFFHADSIEKAEGYLRDQDIRVVLLDLNFGMKGGERYLNIEDMDSVARDFFWRVQGYGSELPIYLLQTDEHIFNAEERQSFLRQGVRGVLALADKADFGKSLDRICSNLHQQQSMVNLAKANKLVTFESAQRLTENGRIAEIKLFDFELAVAVDAEDSGDILSSLSRPDVKFDRVIGAEEAKKELRYFVEYLKNPKKYLGTGVSAPKGVLLYGPPGTGKTMLAKVMASESGVTFIAAEGNQFVKKYFGEGPETVHALFRTARKYAPAILFIDEIDAIGTERRGSENGKSVEETLTALLAEMDGFKKDTSRPVFVLAATNFDIRPGSGRSLDPALLRRFDRRIYIDLPKRDDRIRYMKHKKMGNPAFAITDEKIRNLAIRSTGMSLSDIESVFELSLRTVICEGGLKVTDDILDEAFETFNGGAKRNWDDIQLLRVARHEAGHAFLCWQSGKTPSYVTVVARGDRGGYTRHDDSEEKAIYTKEELLAGIRISLGGRAAEIVYYGSEDGLSTGAGGDLESATRSAQQLICSYGMDDTFGPAVVGQQEAGMGELSCEVRAAVNKILSEEMERATNLIEKNRDTVDGLVEELLTKNHLMGSEIRAVFEKKNQRNADL